MPLKSKVLVYLGLNDAEYNAKMKAAGKKLDKSVNDWRRSGRRLQIASQQVFLGLTVPLTYLGKSIFDATAQLEKMHISLATIARSKGIDNIAELTKNTTALAKLPGLGLAESFKAVTGLLSVGATGEGALAVVEGLGIGIARAGGGAAEFETTMRQIVQGLAKGKLVMQDFRTVFEQMTESRGLVEAAFGTSDLEKLRAKGVQVAEVVAVIAKGYHELGAQDFMGTMANQTENLKDAWTLFRGVLGERIFKDLFVTTLSDAADTLGSLTDAVNNMSPGWKAFILNVTTTAGKLALLLPVALGAAGLFKTLGALLFKNSKILRGLVVGIGGLISSKALLAGGLKKVIPYIGEVIIAVELLRWLFPEATKSVDGFLDKWMKLYRQKVPDWMEFILKKLPIIGAAFSVLDGYGKGSEPDFFDDYAELGKITPKSDFRKALDEFAASMKGLGGDIKTVEKNTKDAWGAMSPWLDEVAGSKFGKGYDPLPGRVSPTSLDGMGPIGDAVPEIYGPASNQFLTKKPKAASSPLLPDIGQISQINQVLAVAREHVEKLQAGPDTTKWFEWEELLSGPLAEGLTGVTESMTTLITDIFSGKGADAFKNFGKAFGQVIQTVIKQIIALIVKLAIAAALMAILFPEGGGLKGLFKAEKGTGAGFLKSILGFADGGIVGGSSYTGDKVLARLNSGEMILNKGQQAAVSNAMGSSSIRLSGDFKIRGRDLVYALEANQKQVNSAR